MNNNHSLSRQTVGGVGRGTFSVPLRTHFSNLNQHFLLPKQLMEENGNGNQIALTDIFSTHICDGVEYTYLTPPSKDAGLDILADSIKTKDFNLVRIAIVCEHACEAEQVKQQLGKRSVACLLLNQPNQLLNIVVRLWTDGMLNSVLVICDDMLLLLLAECGNVKVNVNYLIHSTQPLPHVFQKRIQALTQTPGTDTRVLVLRTPVAAAVTNQLLPAEATATTTITTTTKSTLKLKKKSLVAKRLTEHVSMPDEHPVSGTTTSLDSITPNSKDTSVFTSNNYGTFAWSRHQQLSCFNILEVANIGLDIKAAMKQLEIGHVRAKCVQRYAWSHVATGRSLCVIANEKCGKTWCYLPWLCQRFNEEASQRQDNDYGPSSIILCASAKQGDQIADWCMNLLGKSSLKYERLIKLFDRGNLHEIAARMERSCGILLTSVELMLQLCNLHTKERPILNPLSIRCVAIDNLDIMWRCGRLDCEKLITWLLATLRFEQGHAQLLIAGRIWSEVLMQRLLPKLPDVLLLFEDALEATIYGGIKLELLSTSQTQREQKVIELLLARKDQRVVLACNGKEEANKLRELLLSTNINNVILDEGNQTLAFSQWCTDMAPTVLIAADDVFPRKQGEHVDCLLHYTPANNWPRFKERFRIFYANYQAQHNTIKPTTSIMIVCKTDQIWFICDFMLKHDMIAPEISIAKFNFDRIEAERSQPRSRHPLCRQLLSYGNCCRRKCHYRHILWDYETEPPLHHPNEGEIRFHVLFTLTPAQLAVKLTKYEISNTFLGIPVTKLGETIQLHYQDPSNRVQHINPKPGDVCIVQLNKQYQRVGVIRVDNADRVEVKQLDAGIDFPFVRETELLKCEEHFKNETFEANDVRITGLTPFNMERIWPDDTKKLVRNKFFNRMKGANRVFTAKVDFAFHDMIFVENVFDEDGNDLKSFVIDHMLVHNDNGVKNRLKTVVATARPFSTSIEHTSDFEMEQSCANDSAAEEN